MTANLDSDCGSSQWSMSDLRYEGLVGEKMGAIFLLEREGLPHDMADLLERVKERERPLAPNSRHGVIARPSLRRGRSDHA